MTTGLACPSAAALPRGGRGVLRSQERGRRTLAAAPSIGTAVEMLEADREPPPPPESP